MTPKATLLLNALLLSALASGLRAGEFDEFKIKREAVFDFAAPPALSRDGDRVTIAFETKGFCDVTVCIEDAEGEIVRHLACGVLGEKAPAPFAKGAKKQTLVWDGKDDEGKYIDDKDSHAVRVSLGLKAQFEKALFSSPKKRLASYPPLIAATKEGVLVFEGLGVDYLRLYDHEGEYVRTIYPFPANKLDDIKGLKTETFPQDGKEWPVKGGSTQASLLTSGTSSMALSRYCFGTGVGASALAVSGERIALAFMKLNRLALDGSTGGLPLEGPTVGFTWRFGDQDYDIGPTSAAFAPDGKWLYLTGILWKRGTYGGGGHGHHGVVKLAFDGNEPPQLFAGKMNEDAFGSGDGQFKMPTSVASDAAGRVYVGDYLNDRVQVFDSSGKFLKAIAAPKPMKVQINPRSQELYVFSWSYIYLPAGLYTNRKDEEYENLRKIKPTLTHFGAFDDPKRLAAWDLPVRPGDGGLFSMGPNASVELDFHTDPPTLSGKWARRCAPTRTTCSAGARACTTSWETAPTGPAAPCSCTV